MKHMLFVCGQNQFRSPTAANIFSGYKNVQTRSAGVNNDAVHRADTEDIEWADSIFVMENSQKAKLIQKFDTLLKNKKVIVLNIPDKFRYMDEDLVEALKLKMKPWL